jgi:puromycin-sensitive aminopeptidase
VVSVAASSKDGRKLTLSQSRFSASGAYKEPSAWTIPVVINYRLAGDKRVRTYRTILDSGKKSITLPGKGKPAWVYPNDDETGFYRVKLSAPLLSSMRTWAARDLDPLERMGLLNHLWAQVKSGDLDIADFLDTLRAVRKDSSRVVLEEVSSYLKSLADNIAASKKDKDALKRMAVDLLGPHWQKAGWDAQASEDDEPRLARAAMLSAMAVVAPTPAIEAGLKSRLDRYLADPTKVEPALVSPVLSLSARLGQADFETYRARMDAATTPEQRDAFLLAMAQFRDAASVRKLLDLTLTPAIRGQDAWKPFGALLSNSAAQAEAWDFVKSHWAALKEKLGPRGAERVIAATAGLQSEAWLKDVGSFFNNADNAVPSAKRTLDQTLEAIELGARLRKTQGPKLSAWLSRRYPVK